MTRPARPVITASVRGRTVALRAVTNASGWTRYDVERLVTSAGLFPRTASDAVFVGLSELPDVEAMAEHSGVIVVRMERKS
jgi:hypothetical protein